MIIEFKSQNIQSERAVDKLIELTISYVYFKMLGGIPRDGNCVWDASRILVDISEIQSPRPAIKHFTKVWCIIWILSVMTTSSSILFADRDC